MRQRDRGISPGDIAAVGTGLAVVLASVFLLALVTILYYAALLPLKLFALLLRRSGLASRAMALLAALLLTGGALWLLNRPTGVAEQQVVIQRGAGVSEIGRTLHGHGLIKRPFLFALAAKAYGLEHRVKAGKYALDGGMSTVAILKKLALDSRIAQQVTIPEGLARAEIASLLYREDVADSTAFMRATKDSALCKAIAALGALSDPPPHLEGYLFPDTYEVFWDPDPRSVIQRMLTRFAEVFSDSLRAEAQKQGFSVHQIVTLASLIDKEAKLPEERPWISAVFHRRLREGMLLQADPTVQYALGTYRKRLCEQDLQVDSPYNTYLYGGLPPGPICSPGLASIVAAVYPADVPYLYFVARGDGSHAFSETLKDHLAAKREIELKKEEENSR
jgi:UPF0755 protein